MVRDRRFVDVFDFKSVLTSAQRSGQRAGLGYVHPKRILVVYHDATARGAIAAFDPTGIAPNGGGKSGLAGGVRSALQTHVASQATEIPLGFQRHPLGRECGGWLTRRLCEIVRP